MFSSFPNASNRIVKYSEARERREKIQGVARVELNHSSYRCKLISCEEVKWENGRKFVEKKLQNAEVIKEQKLMFSIYFER